MKKQVALYIRTSTQLQATGLEAQQRALENYCKVNQITNFVVYSDEGISGTKESRPGLNKLMLAAESGVVSSVIVYSFSRFARSVKHLLSALELFDKLKVDFISISENLQTTTTTGRFVFTILAALSAMEREIIADRVKNGLANAKAKGKRLGAPKKHADKVNLIQHLSVQKMSCREIAKLTGVSRSTVSRQLRRCL